MPTGWNNIKKELHFNAKIEKGKDGSITFLNSNYNYSDWYHENNALTFKSGDNSSFITHYMSIDRIDYFRILGTYSSRYL